ncbi:GNAT family N-acetyltransferase [Pedobacter sp.]|uniref:GNAT family N-acetyltransferase n=1 Tax=Pedobacter sp. TaxID=1411316 RepID=UPI003C6ACFFF
MYNIKVATVYDVEDIWTIIERTWLESSISALAKSELIKLLNITHSTQRIKTEIQNNHQRYILVMEKDFAVAFASYSASQNYPHNFRIHKLYNLPSVEGKGYNKVLISYIERLAMDRGCHKLSVVVKENEKKQYFESLGYAASDNNGSPIASETLPGFTMVKILH